MSLNVKATITKEEGDTDEEVQALDTEVQEIIAAITKFMNGGGPTAEFSLASSKEIYDDFLLGLTFPTSIQVGERGSKRRVLLTALSGIWHGVHLQVLNQIAESGGTKESNEE